MNPKLKHETKHIFGKPKLKRDCKSNGLKKYIWRVEQIQALLHQCARHQIQFWLFL